LEFQFSPEDQAFRRELLEFLRQEYSPVWNEADHGSNDASWELTKEMRRKLADRGWLTMH
jgi:alkylation response protein AidB-like acyl-CoA dehydrogenase